MWTRRAARLALVAGTALLGTAGPAAAAAMRLALEGAGEANSDTQSMEATAGRTGVTVIAEATDELPGWRLDIAPPVGQKLQVGRIYEGMVRAGQQTAAVGGVLLVRDGLTCDVVEGRVAIKELTIGAGGRVTRLAATILQRCDGSPDAKSGSVVVTQPAEPPVLRPSQPGGSVFAGGESGAPGRAGYALAFTAHGEARLRRGRSDIRLFTARGGRSFSGDVDASVVTWQTTRRVAGVEMSRIAVAGLNRVSRYRLIGRSGWRWSPVVDGGDLAYNRGVEDAARKQIVVTRVGGGRERVVARATGKKTLLRVAGLGKGILAYDLCTRGPSVCTTRLVRIHAPGAPSRTLHPPAGATAVYSADVAGDGSVYAVVSGRGCGVRVRIVRWALGEGYETIATLPPRVDASELSVNEADGHVRLVFTRYDCGRRDGDLAAISLPEQLSPPAAPGQT